MMKMMMVVTKTARERGNVRQITARSVPNAPYVLVLRVTITNCH